MTRDAGDDQTIRGRVLDIHRSVLEDESVLAEDNFYDMGGDSLLSLQVLGRIERELGVKVPPRTFFTADTIADVADLVAAAAGSAAGDGAPRPAGGHAGRASMAQEWALLSSLRDPQAPILQFHAVFKVSGPFDTQRLEAALNRVAERHGSLRTSFTAADGVARQAVDPGARADLAVMDYRGVPDAEVDEFLRGFVREPFDRSRAPLWRTLVVRRAEAEALLVFVFDHMIADGWSLDTFVEDLSAAYRGTELPDRTGQSGAYADWAAGQWESWQGGRAEELADYWRSQLSPDPAEFALRLPGYRGTEGLSKPASLVWDLDPATARGLRTACQDLRATPYCVSMSVVKALVALATGQGRVTLLTTNANRLDGAYQSTVGWFANGVFPTTDVDLSGTFRDLVSAVRASILGATAHGDMPAMFVRRRIWPELPPGFRKDPGVYFMYNDVWGGGLGFGEGVTVSTHHLTEDADSPGLHMWLLREGEGLRLQALHYESEYAPEYVKGFAGCLVKALDLLTGQPDRPMSDLLDPAEFAAVRG
ncbi:condensation domain-containing protein [Streptomyces sp. NRRL S-87]|uniref:condensation domain-containing protein n=1 Tax=Streptomyces sp. NRRL S-87 TaxID=1463920 RepID=UPI0004BEB4FE|nr:condensation domain-containing protein [Streptomyces sp. NRRL S-87]